MDKTIIYSFLCAFVVSAILGPIFIPLLRRLKFGQSILEIGPKWHMNKSGTPTIGGIIFILGIIASMLVFNRDPRAALIMLSALSFGAIGLIDDFVKVVLKRNLGLTAKQKLILQILAATAFVVAIKYFGYVDNQLIVPFMTAKIDLGILYVPFMVFIIVATVNSVNITDGIDGLAATITSIVFMSLTLAAVVLYEHAVSIFSATVVGGCLGFLLYNIHPAKVFMGDTGSLFLGGAVAATTIVLKIPLFLVLIGLVYIVEALSVMIQVAFFKRTGKRVFKMSPIHHHFEMSGWSERKIVNIFSAITLVLCIVGIVGLHHI